MKHNHHQRKRIFRTAAKPLAVFALLAMNAGAQAVESPFAFIPLHLQTTTTQTSGVGTKPNLIIQFDDSGSMNFTANGQPTTDANKKRITIARNALNKVVSNPDNFNKFNWGLISLWSNESRQLGGRGSRQYAEDFMAGRREFALSLDEMTRLISGLTADKGTPTAERYMDAAHILQKAMKYRCQKSYVILFSDGDAYSYTPIPRVDSANRTFTWANQSSLTFFVPNGFNTDGRKNVLVTRSSPATYYTWVAADPLAHNNRPNYPLLSDAQMQKYTQPLYKLDGFYDYPAMFTRDGAGRYRWNLDNSGTPVTSLITFPKNLLARFVGYNFNALKSENAWSQHPYVLPFLADLMLENDLKTSPRDGNDAAGKSWDDTADGLDPKQNIRTFAVGFGSGLTPIGKLALDGMSNETNRVALNASSPQELDEAFKKIFDQISEQNQVIPPKSISTISPTVGYDTKAPDTLNSATSIHLNLATGSSELRFYNLQKSPSGKNYIVDSSHFTTPDFSQRKVLINHGTGSNNRTSWFDANAPLDNGYFDLVSNNREEWKTSLMPWLTRRKSDSEIAGIANNSFPYRIRQKSSPDTYNMGDVLDSSLEAVSVDQGKLYGRDRYLITAANDGMVYLFESKNDPAHPYTLKLNYMPSAMQRENATDTVSKYYKSIANADYITGKDTPNPHQYLLNGGFTIRITDKMGPQRIFMSGNMGQAGRGSYSLNIGGKKRSDNSPVGLEANDWLASVPLFETEKGTNNKMGYTIGAPKIGRIAPVRSISTSGNQTSMDTNVEKLYYATFVNSGVRHPTDRENTESALYVYSTLGNENAGTNVGVDNTLPAKGQLVQKVVAQGSNGGLAEATIVDTDFDGAVDVAYAGDFKGNLYRFDFRNASPSQWTVSRIFTTNNNRPITAAPAVMRQDKTHYVVIFGTGSDLYQSDLENKDTQSMYGIYDDLNVMNPRAVNSSELLQQNLTRDTFNGTYNQRDLTEHAWSNDKKGWFFNLTANTGERVVTKPTMLLKTAIFTTRQYSANKQGSNTGVNQDVCVPSSETNAVSSSSWLMQVRGDTGGKLPKNDDSFGYIDFAGRNDTGRYKVRPDESLIAGFQYPKGGLLSINLTFPSKNASIIGDSANAYTTSGDVGTGTDIDPKKGGQDPAMCINVDNGAGQMISSSSGDTSSAGINDSHGVFAKQCSSPGLRRISWREIF